MAVEDREFIQAFLAANPDASTADLRQLKKEYPVMAGMVDRILADRTPDESDDATEPPPAEPAPRTKGKRGKKADDEPETPAGPEGFNPRLHAGDETTVRGRAAIRLKALSERAASLPTPGGIGFLVLAILFFWFAIIPVNGQFTRLALIWEMILGHTSLPNEATAAANASAIGAIVGLPSSVTAQASAAANAPAVGVGSGPVSGIASGPGGVAQLVQPRPPVALGRRATLSHGAPFHISTVGYQARRAAEQAAQDGEAS